jgi:hypothetical protein
MITARKAMLAVSDECATSVLHAWVDAVMQLDRRRLMILSRASAVQSHKQGVSP